MKILSQTAEAVTVQMSTEAFDTINQCLIAIMDLPKSFDLDMPALSKTAVIQAISESENAARQFYETLNPAYKAK